MRTAHALNASWSWPIGSGPWPTSPWCRPPTPCERCRCDTTDVVRRSMSTNLQQPGEARTASVLALAQDLIRQPSRAGIDDYRPVLGVLEDWLAARGLPHRRPCGDAGALVGLLVEIPGGRPGKWWTLDACVDTAQRRCYAVGKLEASRDAEPERPRRPRRARRTGARAPAPSSLLRRSPSRARLVRQTVSAPVCPSRGVQALVDEELRSCRDRRRGWDDPVLSRYAWRRHVYRIAPMRKTKDR